MVVPADQGHVLFDVLVVVIVHHRDMNQTFNRILQGNEEAKLHYGRDNGVKGLAHVVLHKLSLFHRIDVAFGINPPPFRH